jgi:hypothetical protein
MAKSLSEHVYIITENIYSSQLSSVAILLQPEPNCFTSYNTRTRKRLCSLSLCAIVLRSPPPFHVSTSNGQRSSQLFCVHYKPCCSLRKSSCCSRNVTCAGWWFIAYNINTSSSLRLPWPASGCVMTVNVSGGLRCTLWSLCSSKCYLRIQSYLKDNTTLHHYEDQLVNAV